MTGRGFDELNAMPVRERAGLNDQSRSTTLLHCSNSIAGFGHVADCLRSTPYARRLGCPLRRLKSAWSIRPPGIPKVVDGRLAVPYLSGQLDELAAQVQQDVAESGSVAARVRETLDDSNTNRVSDRDEHNRYRRRLALRRHSRTGARRYQEPGTPLNQLAHHTRKLGLVLDPYNVYGDMPAFDQSNLAQAL